MYIDPRLSEISLEGFQVVSGQMFAHLPRKSDATCTLWPSSISFSKQSVVLLNNCEHIRIEINPATRGLLVVPVTSKDQDGIRWIKNVKEPVARKIECMRLGVGIKALSIEQPDAFSPPTTRC